MDVEFSKNDAQWKDDVYQIGQYYRRHLQEAKDAEDPARLAQRDADDARKFFDCLFDTINLTTPLSILDVGCGPGNVIEYFISHVGKEYIGQYLGIDLLPEFLDEAKINFQEDNIHFLCSNFLEMPLEVLGKHRLVLACGVLVHHVHNYEEYVCAFIKRMLEVTSGIITFNLITSVDMDSENYDTTPIVGKPRAIDKKILDDILSSLKNCTIRCNDYRLYPDATDTFVQIRI